jgi:hypothetical protein
MLNGWDERLGIGRRENWPAAARGIRGVVQETNRSEVGH